MGPGIPSMIVVFSFSKSALGHGLRQYHPYEWYFVNVSPPPPIMKFLLRGIKSKATAVKGELSSSDYPLYTWILSGVKAREEVFPILDKSFVKFQRNPVSSGEREGGSLTWRQLHSRAAPGVGMGEPAAPPAIDSRNWNRTRATHSQHSYCTAKISGGFDTVHRVLPRVITLNTNS